MHKTDQRILSLGLVTAALVGVMYWQGTSYSEEESEYYTQQTQSKTVSSTPSTASADSNCHQAVAPSS